MKKKQENRWWQNKFFCFLSTDWVEMRELQIASSPLLFFSDTKSRRMQERRKIKGKRGQEKKTRLRTAPNKHLFHLSLRFLLLCPLVFLAVCWWDDMWRCHWACWFLQLSNQHTHMDTHMDTHTRSVLVSYFSAKTKVTLQPWTGHVCLCQRLCGTLCRSLALFLFGPTHPCFELTMIWRGGL